MPNENGSFKNKISSLWAVIKKYAAKVWAYLKEAKMEYIVMIGIFAIDLISKVIVNATTVVGDTVVLIPNFLNIHNVHNYEAAFGSDAIKKLMGSVGSRIFFSIFAVAASVMFIFVLIRCRKQHRVIRISLALLVAGAMGNCIDRMALGYVRDFVEFVYFGLTIAGSKSFYVFNIADAALVIGVILAIVFFLFLYKDKDDMHKQIAENAIDTDGGTETTDIAEGSATEERPQVSDVGETEEAIATDGEVSTSESEQTDDGGKESATDGSDEREADEAEDAQSSDNVIERDGSDDTTDGIVSSVDGVSISFGDGGGENVEADGKTNTTDSNKRGAGKSVKRQSKQRKTE